MLVVVSGSSGLVGQALVPALRIAGHQVLCLQRNLPAQDDLLGWEPNSGMIDWGIHSASAPDCWIHLAGENIAQKRWTRERKLEFRRSRVEATTALVSTLLQRSTHPTTFICASAIGFYGDREEECVDEYSPPGDGFLAELAIDWERATEPLSQAGCRVVNARFGIILSIAGGALSKMMPTFRMGLGATLGTGKQWMSWISLQDVISALFHVMNDFALSGSVNIVSPEPIRNADFSKVLARILRRPRFLRMPSSFLRIVAGEMADAFLLTSQRVIPTRLIESGFIFSDPSLAPALSNIITKSDLGSSRNPD